MTPTLKRVRQTPPIAAASQEPPLAAVVVVCRSQFGLLQPPRVIQCISEFADSSGLWTMESVQCSSRIDDESAVRLLNRLHAREWPGLRDTFRIARGVHNMQFLDKKPLLVDWWLTKYIPLTNVSFNNVILKAAIKHSRINVLEWLEEKRLLPRLCYDEYTCDSAEVAYWLDKRGYSLSVDVNPAIENDDMVFMEWLHNNGNRQVAICLESGIATAARHNNVKMAQWLLDTYSDTNWNEPDVNVYEYSCDLNMIKWLEEHFKWQPRPDTIEDEIDSEYDAWEDSHKLWIEHSIVSAAERGQLDIIKYLYDHPLSGGVLCELMTTAAELGHINVVKWLHVRQPDCGKAALAYAARYEKLEIFEWLHGQSNRPNQAQAVLPAVRGSHDHDVGASIDIASECGNLEIVRWLHMHCPNECTAHAMDAAATKGKLTVVQWLHQHRSEGCTPEALRGAIRNGHLEMVQWLTEHRKECGLSAESMNLAAQYGHLEIAKLLHEVRSEACTADAVDIAAEFGNFEVVEYLVQNRVEGCTLKALAEAAFNGCLAVVKYARNAKALEPDFSRVYPTLIEEAAASGHVHIVHWLINFGIEECRPEAMDTAAQEGNVQVMKYLSQHCNLLCSKAAFKEAVNSNHFAVIEWVLQHDPNFANFVFVPE